MWGENNEVLWSRKTLSYIVTGNRLKNNSAKCASRELSLASTPFRRFDGNEMSLDEMMFGVLTENLKTKELINAMKNHWTSQIDHLGGGIGPTKKWAQV